MDGISILPTLLGKPQEATHESLYFEIYERFFQQAVRMGQWKGCRLGTAARLELYDLQTGTVEKDNIASAHPDIVKQVEAIMAAEHTPSPHYTAPEQAGKGKNKSGGKRQPSLEDLVDDKDAPGGENPADRN